MAVNMPQKIVRMTPEQQEQFFKLKREFQEAEARYNQWLKAFKDVHGIPQRPYAPFYDVEMGIQEDPANGEVYACFDQRLRS